MKIYTVQEYDPHEAYSYNLSAWERIEDAEAERDRLIAEKEKSDENIYQVFSLDYFPVKDATPLYIKKENERHENIVKEKDGWIPLTLEQLQKRHKQLVKRLKGE